MPSYRLYLLRRVKHPALTGYDEADGFVVRASSPTKARELAASCCGDEGEAFWRDYRHTTCEILKPEKGKSEVILRDFNGA